MTLWAIVGQTQKSTKKKNNYGSERVKEAPKLHFVWPFLSWRYSKVPFWEIFNFHLEGKGCPDTYEQRDCEALAR